MFGYATDETEECMPLTVVLAHKLNAKIAELRRNGGLPWARPDSKTQVRGRRRSEPLKFGSRADVLVALQLRNCLMIRIMVHSFPCEERVMCWHLICEMQAQRSLNILDGA